MTCGMNNLEINWILCDVILCGWLGSTHQLTNKSSLPSSSMAVRHQPCLLTLRKMIQASETKCLRRLLLLGAQDQRLGAERDQLLCGPIRTSSGSCQKMETGMRHGSLSKSIFNSGRCRHRQRKCWMDNVREWTSPSCQNVSQWPPAETTVKRSLLNRPSCPPRRANWLNWAEPN